MAKQSGPVKLVGTIDDLTYYESGGDFLVRKKSSLNKDRVKRDPAFANSRKRSEEFGRASKYASKFYHRMPAGKKGFGVINEVTSVAYKLVIGGASEEEMGRGLREWMEE